MTIGFVDKVEPWPVNELDRAYGYDAAFAISNASGNILVGVASGGAGCWAKGAGTTGKIVGYGIKGMDIGGNVVGAGKNVYDIYDNGPNIGNVIGLGGNVGGLAGNLKTRNVTPNNNKEVRRWYFDRSSRLAEENAGLPLRERAIHASLKRNELKQQARDMMIDRVKAAELDITDPILPVEHYIQKYEAKGLVGDDLWQALLEGSARTRPSVNKVYGIE